MIFRKRKRCIRCYRHNFEEKIAVSRSRTAYSNTAVPIVCISYTVYGLCGIDIRIRNKIFTDLRFSVYRIINSLFIEFADYFKRIAACKYAFNQMVHFVSYIIRIKHGYTST